MPLGSSTKSTRAVDLLANRMGSDQGDLMTITLRLRIAAAMAAGLAAFLLSFIQQPGFFEEMGVKRASLLRYRFELAETWGWVVLAEVVAVLTFAFVFEQRGSEQYGLESAARATTIVCTVFTVLAIVSAATLPTMKGY